MKIIFVSQLKSLDNGASSTDIMTFNLIKGLSQNETISKLIIIVNKSNFQNIDRIKIELSPLCEELFIVKSSYETAKNKWQGLFQLLFAEHNIVKFGDSLTLDDIKDSLLISQSPSFDSIHLCERIKKNYPQLRYIQYWSDPVAITGITPEKLNYKRLIFKLIEKKGIRIADRIIYGTKILFEAQKEVYPKLKDKMDYIDVSYSEFDDQAVFEDRKYGKDRLLYAGNYFSKIRNLNPLFTAVDNLNGVIELDVYGSGDVITESKFVHLHYRISPLKLREEEIKYQTVICVLNSNCIQIPGKIFYSMNLEQNILVILDGTRKDEMAKYLKSYNRFIMCDNDPEMIKDALMSLMDNNFETKNYKNENYSPKAIANKLLEKSCKCS